MNLLIRYPLFYQDLPKSGRFWTPRSSPFYEAIYRQREGAAAVTFLIRDGLWAFSVLSIPSRFGV